MGLQISVLNLSNTQWTRNVWKVGAGQSSEVNWTDEVTQSPSAILIPYTGAVTAAATSENLAFFVMDALYMQLGYTSSEGSFAVQLQQLFHMFNIGKQDQWAYFDGKWSEPTACTSPHTWTFETTTVIATPRLNNSSGLISVTISNHS